MAWSDETSTFTATGCSPGRATAAAPFTVDAYGQQTTLGPNTKLTAWLVPTDPANPPDLDPTSPAHLPPHTAGVTISSSVPAGANTWRVQSQFPALAPGKYQLIVLTDGATPQHALVDTSAADGLFQVT